MLYLAGIIIKKIIINLATCLKKLIKNAGVLMMFLEVKARYTPALNCA